MIVAVTQRIVQEPLYKEMRDALSHDWHNFLARLGADLVLPVPNIEARSGAWLSEVSPDLLILSGGNDVLYGQRWAGRKDEMSRKRDRTEAALLETALREGIPVLGVCRGMQFIHAYYGGELTELDGHAGEAHHVEVLPSGAVARNNLMVNSYHRYGINTSLHAELIPLAIDKDGNVEAFMHRMDPLLAIMWHPERENGCFEVESEWIDRLVSKRIGAEWK